MTGPDQRNAAPVVLRPAQQHAGMVLEEGGLLRAFSNGDDQQIWSSLSRDKGATWSDPTVEFAAPGGGVLALRDSRNELHLFGLAWRDLNPDDRPSGEAEVGQGRTIGVDRFLDVWHCRTVDRKWQEAGIIFEGYVGALNGVVELSSGRIVLPFADWRPGVPVAPPTGPEVVTAVYSDDGGASWRRSDAALASPCYTDFNGNNYGACEPTVAQLRDGRVYMIARTQTGRMYASHSADGVDWAPLRPSIFRASDSPGGLVRTTDGRLVLLWNNCEKPLRANGQGVYGGRDALHAAVSEDDGRTWRGFREVYRDPFRNEPPPKKGDRGTAYPFPCPGPDGTVVFASGQGEGRRNLLRFHPDWLLEKHARSDFSDGLERWHVYKLQGPAERFWRSRRQGAALVEGVSGRRLHVRRPEGQQPDGAAWNFPMGERGRLALRVQCQSGIGGAAICLADRLFDPSDERVLARALYCLAIAPDGRVALREQIPVGEWIELEFDWDWPGRTCVVSVNGESRVWLKPADVPSEGPSYLHLFSTAPAPDEAGLLLDWVDLNVR